MTEENISVFSPSTAHQMKATSKFQNLVMTSANSKEGAFGFDFSMLLAAILPILLDQLQACLPQQDNQELATQMASKSLLTQIVVRRSMRSALREADQRIGLRDQYNCVDCLLHGLSDEQTNLDLISETKAMSWALA
jgi:hypothetical protein